MFRPSFLIAWLLLLFLSCQSSRTELVCGGGAEFSCPTGFYCHLGDKCGGIDREGTCRPLVQDCPLENSPICSCSGKNFQSACYAAAAGETVAYAGACMNKD